MKAKEMDKHEVVEESGEYSARGDTDKDLPKIKKPSMKGIANSGHLGEFGSEAVLSEGHKKVSGGMEKK